MFYVIIQSLKVGDIMASIWKDESNKNDTEQDNRLFLEIEEFFNHIQDSKHLQYRDGQRSMAYSVVDTIKDKQILLIEAGVGIGKSYAYLIPLIQSIKDDDKFKGFIIATSTIALQEQLIRDVNEVFNLLGIDKDSVNVVLAKGKNNYICRKRLNEFLKTSGNEKYAYILDEVIKNDTIDRKDFEDISDKMWRNFNVRTCSTMACPYYADCKISMNHCSYDNAKIVITNQDLLVQDLKKDNDSRLFKDDRVIVIDEAHNLEEKIRNSYVLAIDKKYIESLLYRLYYSVSDYDEIFLPPQSVFDSLTEFFTRLRASAKNEIRKVDESIDNYYDCNRVKFNCGYKLSEATKRVINSIKSCIDEVKLRTVNSVYSINDKVLNELYSIIDVLNDMLKNDKSNNIYWVDFMDAQGKYLHLTYAPKKIDELSSTLLSKHRAGIILTSATLTIGRDNYDYYSKSVGLDKVVGKNVLKEFSEISPYDYERQALLYCPKDISSPRDKDTYLEDISNRIYELISITGGKSLILFTSKSDMNIVYNNVKSKGVDFPLYIQKEGSNVKALKEKFESDISSCLFATGSFYEGIDVKGSSLSQVIIAKLPFPIVDPVIDYKANEYKDGFYKVYLPDMITKLKQGTGRAIRSEDDTAIISILDPRIHDYNVRYNNMVFDSLPFTNVTDDITEVAKFANKKIK